MSDLTMASDSAADLTHDSAPPPAGLATVLRRILVASMILHALLLICMMTMRVAFPYGQSLDVSQYQINRSLDMGIDPYSMEGRLTPPYYAAGYGPVFYMSNYAFAKVFGDSIRTVRLLHCLIAIALIAGVARMLSMITDRNRFQTALFTSVFLGFYSTTYMFCRIRPDLLALMFAIYAMLIAWKAVRKPRSEAMLACMAILLALALFTKQTYAMTGVFILVYFAAYRRFDLCIRTIAYSILAAAMVWIACSMAFHHANWIYPLLIPTAGHVESGVKYAIANMKSHFTWTGTAPAILLMGVLATAAWVRRNGASSDTGPCGKDGLFFAFWFFASGLIAFLLSFMTASSVHYLAEFGVATAVLLASLYRKTDVRNSIVVSVLLQITLLGAIVGDIRQVRGEWFSYKSIPYQKEVAEILTLNTPEADPVCSFFSNIPTLTGREIHFLDNSYYVHYGNYGFNIPELYGVFDSYMKDRKFSAILIHPEDTFFSPEYLESYGYRRVKTRIPRTNRTMAPDLYLRDPAAPAAHEAP